MDDASGLHPGDKRRARISSTMSGAEMIQILVEHDCPNVTSELDTAQCSDYPVAYGGFSDVYKGYFEATAEVAIKCPRFCIHRDDAEGRKVLKRAARELYIWSRLKHDNIVELIGLAEYRDRMAMVAPWMANGTLLEYIRRNPEVNRYPLLVQIARGVAYLHDNNTIHGDLKSGNVLVSDEGVAKIADFGCTILKRTSTLSFTTTTTNLGHSTRWAAPEVLQAKVERSKEADVYALGMTFLETVTGHIPFSDIPKDVAVISAVFSGQVPARPEQFASFTDMQANLLWEVLKSTWMQEYLKRPGLESILKSLRIIEGTPTQSSAEPPSGGGAEWMLHVQGQTQGKNPNSDPIPVPQVLIADERKPDCQDLSPGIEKEGEIHRPKEENVEKRSIEVLSELETSSQRDLNMKFGSESSSYTSKDGRPRFMGDGYHAPLETHGRHDDIWTQAVTATPGGHPDEPARLNSLGNAYQLLFKTYGRHDDLSRAVDCHSQAVALTPDGHPDKPTQLNSLGNAYRSLFKTYGRHDDISRAVDCHSQVVLLTPDGHPDKPAWLNNLGSTYQSLFQTFGRHDDLSRSIDYYGQAVLLAPDGHPHKPVWLNNLGSTYQSLFQTFGRRDDISRAVDCHSLAIVLTPDGHPDKPARLNNLGSTYQSLFQTFGRHDDISRAVDCNSQAVALTPDGHPNKPAWLKTLGDSYLLHWGILGRHDDVDKVHHPQGLIIMRSPMFDQTISTLLSVYKDAALMHTGHPAVRLGASRMWAKLSSFVVPRTLEAHTRCIQLLSEAVWLSGSVHDRFVCLENRARHLVTEAVAAAIDMHKYDLAIEWLEQGRCMVWTQLLELRMPLDDLRDAHPEAAEELQHLSMLLEHRRLSLSDEARLDIAQRHRWTADKRAQLIKEIRQLAGFEDFLQRPTAAQLTSYVRAHAAVVVNVSPERCDALVIRSGTQSVENVPLPDFSYQRAVDVRTETLERLRTRGTVRGFKMHRAKPKMSIEKVLAVLWYEVTQPVLRYLGISEVRTIDELPHIVWCVTGPLSFLPVHAAGDYTTGDPSTIMHNLVVSSYAPNLSTLGRLAVPAVPFSGMLAVGVSASVRSAAPLPMVKCELSHVHRQFEDMKFTRLDDEDAVPDRVLHAMASHSWVHLACHGSQDRKNPLQSAFRLYDADLDLATISHTRLPHADFAFLSACKTAAGDAELPDEAVHLAAGLLMAGYRSVIASMWAIYDEHAPEVAGSVYRYMLVNRVPDSSRAARALHKAMADLREAIGVDKYDAWVPYIHMGC